MSHTTKLLKRVIEQRLKKEMQVTVLNGNFIIDIQLAYIIRY